jgi:hypothetical protein
MSWKEELRREMEEDFDLVERKQELNEASDGLKQLWAENLSFRLAVYVVAGAVVLAIAGALAA